MPSAACENIARQALLAGAQRAFGAAPQAHVVEHHDRAAHLSRLSRIGAALSSMLISVPALRDQRRVIRESHDLAGLEHLLDRVVDGLTRVFIDDVEDRGQRLAAGFIDGPSGEIFGDGIQEGDVALRCRW